jgi:hypothetical protein
MTFIVTLAAGAGEATLCVVRAFIDPDNFEAEFGTWTGPANL